MPRKLTIEDLEKIRTRFCVEINKALPDNWGHIVFFVESNPLGHPSRVLVESNIEPFESMLKTVERWLERIRESPGGENPSVWRPENPPEE